MLWLLPSCVAAKSILVVHGKTFDSFQYFLVFIHIFKFTVGLFKNLASSSPQCRRVTFDLLRPSLQLRADAWHCMRFPDTPARHCWA
jgi:hypothetical protein